MQIIHANLTLLVLIFKTLNLIDIKNWVTAQILHPITCKRLYLPFGSKLHETLGQSCMKPWVKVVWNPGSKLHETLSQSFMKPWVKVVWNLGSTLGQSCMKPWVKVAWNLGSKLHETLGWSYVQRWVEVTWIFQKNLM